MLSNSRFHTLRAYIALAWVDGVPTDDEKEWINEQLGYFGLSAEQEQILREDMAAGLQLKAIIPKITEPADMTLLVNQARILFNLDGDYTDAERALYDSLKETALGKIDLPAALGKGMMRHIEASVDMEKKTREFRRELTRNMRRFGGRY